MTDLKKTDYGGAAYDADFDVAFQNHYRERLAESGKPFSFYEPAYRFGYQLASAQQGVQQEWDAVEAEARALWQNEHGENAAWEQVQEAVSMSWQRSKA